VTVESSAKWKTTLKGVDMSRQVMRATAVAYGSGAARTLSAVVMVCQLRAHYLDVCRRFKHQAHTALLNGNECDSHAGFECHNVMHCTAMNPARAYRGDVGVRPTNPSNSYNVLANLDGLIDFASQH